MTLVIFKMAAPFKKTAIKTYPKISENVTSDTLYWKSLEFPITKKESAAVTHVDFSPVEPYHYAVTNSAKITVYSSRTNQVIRTLSRFRDVAHCGSFRGDGRLLVAGGDEGVVRLFDTHTKSLLRVFKGHAGPVHLSKFTRDGLHIVSGSDDKSVRVYDIPTETEVVSFTEHQDYVRCGVTSKASNDIFLTGSYDHTVKLFDRRSSESVLTVDHGSPVEAVLMYPGGALFLSAGGNVIKVWDALAGGKLLTTFSDHHKTITCLGFSSNYERIISGSLDRHLKIYDTGTYQVVHTIDYPSAILSAAIAPDNKVVVVGMADGLLSIQHRKEPQEPSEVKKKKKKSSYRYTLDSQKYLPRKGDHVVTHNQRPLLAAYDKYLKAFRYTQALDAAINFQVRVHTPHITISVIQELMRRDGLRGALAGRDDKSLSCIIKFIQKNIGNPTFTSPLIDVANMLLDLYVDRIGQSPAVDVLLSQLKRTIDGEVTFMKLLLQVMGTVDTLLAASQDTDKLTTDIAMKPSAMAITAST